MKRRLAAGARETFESLKVRNFRLFFSGQLISQTGNWLTMVTLSLLILDLKGTGLAVGALAACQFAPMLLLGAWTGALADRIDKRKLLTRVQAAAMVQSFVLAAMVFTHNVSVPAVYVLAFVQGILTAFDNPVRRAFVVEMVDDELLPNAVSLNSAVMTGSRVVGPALAGAIVVLWGYGWAFLLDAVSYVAVIIGLLMMRPSELFTVPVLDRVPGQIKEGFAHARSKIELWIPLAMMGIVGLFAFNFQVTMPLLVTGPLNGSKSTFPILLSIVSLGSVIGALWRARARSSTLGHLVISSAAFGVTMMLLALAPNLLTAMIVGFFLGMASIAFMTESTAIIQLKAEPEFRGRLLAMQAMVFLGSTPIGGPLIGAISDWAGPRFGVAVGGLACLAAAAFGYSKSKQDESDSPVTIAAPGPPAAATGIAF